MAKLLALLAILQVPAHATWAQAEPLQWKLVADSRMEKDCKSGGGLLGAMNCITKRIEGATESNRTTSSASAASNKTGITTKSVQNPDGSRTITKTDKDGNLLSTENKGKSPVSATSTDVRTGITTKSVRNSDGTRTVTKTDKDGNILSRKELQNPRPR